MKIKIETEIEGRPKLSRIVTYLQRLEFFLRWTLHIPRIIVLPLAKFRFWIQNNF